MSVHNILQDPFDPDNTAAIAVGPSAVRIQKCLQVDKLQPRGASESAGIRVGDVFLRLNPNAHPDNPANVDHDTWVPLATHVQLKLAYQVCLVCGCMQIRTEQKKNTKKKKI